MNSLRYFFIITTLFALGLCAQTVDSNSITVAVSRSVAVPAEQVRFDLFIGSRTLQDLSSLQDKLRSAGISGATFTGFESDQITENLLNFTWDFTMQVPYAKVNDQLAVFQKAAATLQRGSQLDFTYRIGATLVSDATIQDTQKKMLADLMADARKRAAAIAEASNVSVGQVLSISDVNVGVGGIFVFSPIPASRVGVIGDPIAGIPIGSFGTTSPTLTVGYTIIVKFAALRYS